VRRDAFNRIAERVPINVEFEFG